MILGAPARWRAGGRIILTCCRDKLYHYDVLGPLILMESALNAAAFSGGMAAAHVAMFSG